MIFFIDPSLIYLVEADPFHVHETESAIYHINKLVALGALFSDEIKMQHYYLLKYFPAHIKQAALQENYTINSLRKSIPLDLEVLCTS